MHLKQLLSQAIHSENLFKFIPVYKALLVTVYVQSSIHLLS